MYLEYNYSVELEDIIVVTENYKPNNILTW